MGKRYWVTGYIVGIIAANASSATTNLGVIYPLGDSITEGDHVDWSGGTWGVGTSTDNPIPGGYRAELYADLANAGYSFQSAGTQTTNSTPALLAAGLADHDGHPGYFSGNLMSNLAGSEGGDPGYWLTGLGPRQAIYPDITLLMAGTNDEINGINPYYDMAVMIDPLISTILQLRPTTHLYVAELLPTPELATGDGLIPIWNSLLPAEVSKWSALGFNITLVPTYAAFQTTAGADNTALFGDGLHPNSTGYNLLGDIWNSAILAGQALNVTGPVNLASAASTSVSALAVGAVNISVGGSLSLDSVPHHTVLISQTLTFTATAGMWQGTLNLADNDMIVHGGNVADITTQLQQGFDGGTWAGSGGITSSVAREAVISGSDIMALGVELNSDGSGVLMSSFDGQAVTSTDVLVKYTLFGDADLSGAVTGSDYTLIDSGYNNKLIGWRNGDFNYDGIINGDDYTLIDNAFNAEGIIASTRSAVSSNLIAVASDAKNATSVPEAGCLTLFLAGPLVMRRHRRPRSGSN